MNAQDDEFKIREAPLQLAHDVGFAGSTSLLSASSDDLILPKAVATFLFILSSLGSDSLMTPFDKTRPFGVNPAILVPEILSCDVRQ
jgi:hypothetical protein